MLNDLAEKRRGSLENPEASILLVVWQTERELVSQKCTQRDTFGLRRLTGS